ncbi:hypothetical protein LTR36_002979 [Oleoguttula mirabilis]|uniref:Amino acid transporter n=1 Tax=Oleoguttula mirabilis TaxID=1507867 RepID=A0AAV9JW78_9PEZI|nr:hypothetical protein LTR36_002979 [Oleoguttula mirabilis]
MDESKSASVWPESVPADDGMAELDDEMSEKFGNEHDKRDMARMGKRQELRREFQFFSIWGYAVILGCSWEFALIDGVLSLPNGGTAGTVWMFLVACAGMFFVTLSMAEMASIAPTAGGQYHWSSEFAPKKYQKPLSFFVGFFCVLGWQTSLAAACYASAQQIVAIMVVANPDYVFAGWHTALFSWAVLVFAIFANTVMFRKLPLIEGLVMFLHVFGFFAIVIVLWVTAPRSDSTVLTTFESNGWPSSGVACLVGLNAAIGDIIGADSSVHLSEELKNASWILPRSMVATAIMNYVLGFITIITLVYCLGDFDAALGTATGQPYVEVVYNATQSTGGTIAIAVVVLILVAACAVNNVTTSSRQLWCALLSDIDGSTADACVGLSREMEAHPSAPGYPVCGLGWTCILVRRLSGEPLPPSRFNLGKSGNAINIIALCFLVVAWVFQFFPSAPNPTPDEMNWSVLIYGACFVFFALYYWVRARHRYTGPVAQVRKDI